MKSNYKQLGPYIREVVEKNSKNQIEKLLGVSIQKCFIPSIANTIGTDMTTYKIVREYQFAYGPVTSRNGDKISVALLQESDCIVSTSYTVFEVINHDDLLPEYLMMWFRRPEFDRYARYMSHGSVREIFDWEEMCNVELPIPPIEKQKEIVAEYNAIANRIKLNEQLNQKLEETAQAIYKHWFVDFEFPDENGKPYKSSGGEMVKCGSSEMPNGNWYNTSIGNYVKLKQGLVINATTTHLIKPKGLPLLRITDLINGTKEIFIDESVEKKNIANLEDVIVTRTGQVGLTFRNKEGVIHNNCFKVIPNERFLHKDYLYRFLKNKSIYHLMVELAKGSSAQYDLTHTAFNTLPIILPPIVIQTEFSQIIKPIEKRIVQARKEIYLDQQIIDIFLSNLAKVREN